MTERSLYMIEWSRVDELRDELGDDDFAEIVDLFIAEVEDVIAIMRKGTDPTDLQRHLHFLKGSALNLGFAHFSDLCRDGEFACKEGRPGDVDLCRLRDAFLGCREVFLAGRADATG